MISKFGGSLLCVIVRMFVDNDLTHFAFLPRPARDPAGKCKERMVKQVQ